jgi:hypothetical protein
MGVYDEDAAAGILNLKSPSRARCRLPVKDESQDDRNHGDQFQQRPQTKSESALSELLVHPSQCSG